MLETRSRAGLRTSSEVHGVSHEKIRERAPLRRPAGRGDIETLSAFALFDDGDDAALRKANDAREAALYPDGLLHWKRIFTAAQFLRLAL
jgi:hypothetical protein